MELIIGFKKILEKVLVMLVNKFDKNKYYVEDDNNEEEELTLKEMTIKELQDLIDEINMQIEELDVILEEKEEKIQDIEEYKTVHIEDYIMTEEIEVA